MEICVFYFALILGCVSGKSLNANVVVNTQGWHLHVTMHVYSGRADPTWLVHSDHPSYEIIIRNMQTISSQPIPHRLGYRGFSLVHVPPGQSVNVGGHYNQTVTLLPHWEMLLLATSKGVDDDLKDHAKQAIFNKPSARKKRSYSSFPYSDYGALFGYQTTVDPINLLTDNDMYKLAKLMGFDKTLLNITVTPIPSGPTKFEPSKWNVYFVKDHNNCYNYANNRITDTFAQPGRAGKCTLGTTPTGTDIEKAALCDGLKVVQSKSGSVLPQHGGNLVALVFWPPKPGSSTFDYHWYRMDGNKRWSHKPGHTDATNVDSSEMAITDPRHADRGPYTEFISFLETRQDNVLLI